ncbi:MAG: phosphonopyruvate decarboxylase [Azoarcus sp.]|jgi:phosphonopyruvate decarboxylase|nr:phosphonopyruvate decarboxylase [Azoarcus sp.]
MIDPREFLACLREAGVDFLAGVPDSLLQEFCAAAEENLPPDRHIITANEGNAVALVSGFHLATGKIGAVYLQNSGLGNAVNPLTSLADAEVYRIPMLLIIGWRGEPGVKDEPQHIKQGRITPQLLEVLEIPSWNLDAESNTRMLVTNAIQKARQTGTPVAFLVRKNTFAKYTRTTRALTQGTSLRRETALRCLVDLAGDALIVSTTGKTSRELHELRQERHEPQRDFLTVGSMGHTASIALGLALGRPDKRVVCLDGDGSLLMHMGALPIIGSLKPARLLHVLLNNAAHESVGGQATVADRMDFRAIALASGYTAYEQANSVEEISRAWNVLTAQPGPLMLEIKLATGARENLGRPTRSPEENKKAFMEWVAR